ncbi:MAG: low molecular weight phosphatase family protein [Candidatus Paceibacterota bacterium]|jgi:protein-tyrosine-phosphatase
MKILFVCKGNVGRSTIAAALFTKYSGIKAFSAGTMVLENENQKIKEVLLAEPLIRFMKKEGIDVAENTRTQLTPEMVQKFDKIIVMAEPETIPEYLSKSDKMEFWDIENPKGMNDEGYEKIISQIKSKLQQFIKENM